MEQNCKKSNRNHKNDLKLFETPDLSWLTAGNPGNPVELAV